MNTKNPVILVTGASSGIGYHTAKILAASTNCHIIAIARSATALEALKADCQNTPGTIYPLSIDLLIANDLNKLQNFVTEAFGKLDAIINNAGLLINKPFTELTDNDWHTTLETNLLAPVKLIRMFYQQLCHSQLAHVVNISSMGGFQGSVKFPGLSAYSTAKGGLSILTESLQAEFGEKITVNCINLGAVDTPMLQQAFPDLKTTVSPNQISEFISNFTLHHHHICKGKTIPLAATTP
ncbi:Fatty acyl-CoA reductase [Piscirickettsia salmonis]|uniref:SDR family NAD(P)-dependent oxidoreductase n=1 Tax=Piscirickettsia salmonis TaxID=1238 RepID=UPI0012BAFCA5|nr:SDR family oxidoreductase [Piscirickettsia salmonis]QGP52980.1 Fatty acyl-CoA reductase [Piscirickettsia salmonis]QGP61089.1 Fatty acyl-CoA reductase [Piscirickettsia salmonis]QGP62552.1 Fatty acyl-CoA reductase [Piscirickettsia salmonis]